MIYVYHANEPLKHQFQHILNERELIQTVMTKLNEYTFATSVKHAEIDIAFAVTGGPTNWLNADAMSIQYTPAPKRPSDYGDIFFERAGGYVNLATPLGFIPLVDVIEQSGRLLKKRLN